MTVEDARKAKRDFINLEYREASTAHFHGVDIGYTVVKQYVAVNALLVALIGALGTVEIKNPVLPSPVDIARIVPWVAIALSVILILVLPQYWAHLKNRRDRCVQIEGLYGGKLFTNLAEISRSARFESV